MAYWKIKRLKAYPNLLVSRIELTAQMEDTESGEVKYANPYFTPDLEDVNQHDFLCNLQEDQGFTPNDFDEVCVI